MIRPLTAAFILCLFSTFSAFAAEIISAEQAEKQARENAVYLVDIRRPSEWKESGVAANAHKITMHDDTFLAKLEKLTSGKKDAPIALICATGGRTAWLAAQLEKRGYSNIRDVSEGMYGSRTGSGWLKKKLPLSDR